MTADDIYLIRFLILLGVCIMICVWDVIALVRRHRRENPEGHYYYLAAAGIVLLLGAAMCIAGAVAADLLTCWPLPACNSPKRTP